MSLGVRILYVMYLTALALGYTELYYELPSLAEHAVRR